MNSSQLTDVASPVTDDTLASVPTRALRFLQATGTAPEIRATLSAHGYSATDHAQAWSLLHAATGFVVPDVAGPLPDTSVRKALSALDAWDEDGFRLLRASWSQRFPEQLAFVLSGKLRAQQGAMSVVSVSFLLDRLDALAASPERECSREQDTAALSLLAERGLDKAKRAELRVLVDTAQHFIPTSANSHASEQGAVLARKQALVSLYHWLNEWTEIARVAVKRRDQLIRLGLLKRKAKKVAALAELGCQEASESKLELPNRI